MTLIKTSILTAISTIIKILSGLVINKVMAIYVGPGGLALVGQFRNFSSMLTTFSNGAITQGIIKYTAEYQDIDQKSKIFSTSLIISLVCSVFIGLIFYLLFYNIKNKEINSKRK